MAVSELIREGWLQKQSNGRLAIKQNGAPRRKPFKISRGVEPPKDWENLFMDDVIRLSLMGKADYLREEATAERYGIGRTVVRQVFSRLAGKGILEHVPRCGWRVRTFSYEDMRDYLEVREVLELKALDLARARLEADELQRMLKGNLSPKEGELPPLDNRLHRYFIEKSQNHFIKEFFSQPIALYYMALFELAAPETSVVAEMAKQHCQILRPLMERKWQEARRALAHHIRSQRAVVKKLMEKMRGVNLGAHASSVPRIARRIRALPEVWLLIALGGMAIASGCGNNQSQTAQDNQQSAEVDSTKPVLILSLP